MEQAVQDFIDGKRIALVGMSRGGKKFGNMAYKELKERGYQVYPVHPEAEQIDGENCYKNLASLPESVDGVLVVVPPERSSQVMRDAAEAGIRNVWLQQGAESPEVLALGEELDLNLVSKKCILMYAEPVGSVHGVHRFFVKLFGKL
jgi:predicted CoA-binding protein